MATQIKSRLDRNYSPCCVPTKLESLEVVLTYYSQKEKKFVNVVDKLEDALVKSCRCH